MSIVGTRPPLISETNLYEPRHKVRLAIKPGITGMWQVSGRSDITDFEEVVRLDKEYIENSCMLNKGEFVFELTNSTQRAEQFVGSKYVKSNPKTIYIDIERKLQEGKKVLFVGLPCIITRTTNRNIT